MTPEQLLIRTAPPALLLAAVLLAAPPARPAGPLPGVAVVELFTSEGCSSCPPAERLLAQLRQEAHSSGQPVYTLEFHVDYWDHLGWKDPYDARACSRRQERYEDVLGADNLYTPQMVVNGRTEFVGSLADRARAEVNAALARPAAAAVHVSAQRDARGRWDARWQVEGAPADAVVCVALVESDLRSQVRRGENQGRTLIHSSVVRAFESFSVGSKAAGDARLTPSTEVDPAHARVVAFVQDRRTLAVLGAAASP